jgi:hypothetical protein
MSNKKSYLGNIRFFDLEKLNEVTTKLTTILDEYGKNSFHTEEVIPCCSPKYYLISFKVDVLID